MILGTAGHIDHGKTALVRALTGVDTDRLPEEKRRGITIDLGFAPLQLEGVGTVGIVDVPGHEAFVRTMLAGATGIDVALLVVAADEGVMPQTREHLEILKLLDVPVPIVALTKSDLADAEWANLVSEEIGQLVASRLGENPSVIRVSSVTGEGIELLRSRLGEGFRRIAARNADDLFRMPVDRAFTIRGTGTVVSGTVWSGRVDTKSTLRLLPSGMESRVRRIESHGVDLEFCEPGTRCAIALTDIPLDLVGRGDVLVSGDGWKATRRLVAQLQTTNLEERPENLRGGLRLHLGTSETGARITASRELAADGNCTIATLALSESIVARAGDHFILRRSSPGTTVGGGIVLDPDPPRRAAAALGIFENGLEKERTIPAQVHASGPQGLTLDELTVRSGLSRAHLVSLLEKSRDVVHAGDRLFSRETLKLVSGRVEAVIKENEVNFPMGEGVSLQTARTLALADDRLVDLALEQLLQRGKIEVDGKLVRSSGWSPKLDSGANELLNDVLHEICAASREPPSVAELVERKGKKVPELLRLLEREGRVVRVDADRFYDTNAVTNLVEELRRGMADGAVYAPSKLREILGLSRKYLIPFLEYCDRLGVTERQNEGRRLRVGA